jgi:hypothetical protein
MMESYDQHPILKFNDEFIGNDCDNPHLWVSINTDDIGVFDTSLENEYAVMFDAICRMRHKQGDYDDYKVYQYLDYLRQNGIAMAFKKAVNELPADSQRNENPACGGKTKKFEPFPALF